MIIGCIPARYSSSRLPGKPLLQLGESNMIQRVYKQSCKSKYIDKIYVITDDERIQQSIQDISGNVLIVKENCLNGTERICIALNKYTEIFEHSRLIVNIQGDEPFINPEHIDISIQKMINNNINNIKCSTLHFKLKDENMLKDKSIGKLILDKYNCIIYCSRNIIPAMKNIDYDLEKNNYYGHIGLFVFDINYLRNEYMLENTQLQLIEDIEWLKIIEQNYKIISSEVDNFEIGVNTINDYNYLKSKYGF